MTKFIKTLWDKEEEPKAYYGYCKLCGEELFNDMINSHFEQYHNVIEDKEQWDWLIQD